MTPSRTITNISAFVSLFLQKDQINFRGLSRYYLPKKGNNFDIHEVNLQTLCQE